MLTQPGGTAKDGRQAAGRARPSYCAISLPINRPTRRPCNDQQEPTRPGYCGIFLGVLDGLGRSWTVLVIPCVLGDNHRGTRPGGRARNTLRAADIVCLAGNAFSGREADKVLERQRIHHSPGRATLVLLLVSTSTTPDPADDSQGNTWKRGRRDAGRASVRSYLYMYLRLGIRYPQNAGQAQSSVQSGAPLPGGSYRARREVGVGGSSNSASPHLEKRRLLGRLWLCPELAEAAARCRRAICRF
jgi:hypothetical protein